MNHDTFKYTFEFPDKSWTLGVWPGGHLGFHAVVNGKAIKKMYTPISPICQRGSVEFVVKTYRPNDEYPNGGSMSQYLLDHVQVGDMVEMSGPKGRIKYLGNGTLELDNKLLPKKSQLALCVAGSGITPALSFATAAVMSGDDMDIPLIFSNKTKNDIICDSYIKNLQAQDKKGKFRVFHCLNEHDPAKHGEWNGY